MTKNCQVCNEIMLFADAIGKLCIPHLAMKCDAQLDVIGERLVFHGPFVEKTCESCSQTFDGVPDEPARMCNVCLLVVAKTATGEIFRRLKGKTIDEDMDKNFKDPNEWKDLL